MTLEDSSCFLGIHGTARTCWARGSCLLACCLTDPPTPPAFRSSVVRARPTFFFQPVAELLLRVGGSNGIPFRPDPTNIREITPARPNRRFFPRYLPVGLKRGVQRFIPINAGNFDCTSVTSVTSSGSAKALSFCRRNVTVRTENCITCKGQFVLCDEFQIRWAMPHPSAAGSLACLS